MALRRMGRDLTAAALAVAALAALAAVLVLAGCGRHATTPATTAAEDGSAQGGSYRSEAERTKAMEAKARELDQKAAEIQNMQGTEQEKIDAVNKLEQERQDLNKTGGDGSAPGNPPPQ